MSDQLRGGDPRETRLQAMRENLEWLEDHDLDEESDEAAKRLGLIKGDAQALVQDIGDEGMLGSLFR